MRIYYAHHLWKYGTEIERYEIALMDAACPGCTIFNPNGGIYQGGEEAGIMLDCVAAVDQCDALIFSDLSGVVGKGVITEIERAQAAGKPVGRILGHAVRWLQSRVEYRLLNTGCNRVYAEIEGAR